MQGFVNVLQTVAAVLASGRAAGFLLLAAIFAAFLTYGTFTSPHTFGLDAEDVIWLLNFDVGIFCALALSMSLRFLAVVRGRRRFRTRLELRLVGLFAGLAVAPAVVVSAIAAVFFSYSVDIWFNEKVNSALEASLDVADAYLQEHQNAIRADALAMRGDLGREALLYGTDPFRLSRLMTASAEARSLTEAIIFDGATAQVLVRTPLAYSLSPELVSLQDLEDARGGKVVLKLGDEGDRMRALVKFENAVDWFILVGRWVEPKVIAAVQRNQEAVRLYEGLRTSLLGVQDRLILIFVLTTLLIALAAGWAGILYADDLLYPLSALVSAAKRVGDGDLHAEVNVSEQPQTEIDSLSSRFNIMLQQLRQQQQALLDANHELEQRSALIGSVLAGSSAGVINLDENGDVTLANTSALTLLNISEAELLGKNLAACIPEFAVATKRPFATSRSDTSTREWEIVRALEPKNKEAKNKESRNKQVFQVRATLQKANQNEGGTHPATHVITFDDVTSMIEAQRRMAWSDVAQRMAHEIKNPLTPIQLSAERLLRKYGDSSVSDTADKRSDFHELIDTIIRQVNDIRRMVTEFAQFARLPRAELAKSNLLEICRDACFLVSEQNTRISIRFDATEPLLPVVCDSVQIRQALINLLLNAVQALESVELADSPAQNSEIVMSVAQSEQETAIIVEDNGPGLPIELIDRLSEPYVSSHPKGTGLGLAIVSQIMDNHKGRLVIENRQEAGAKISLILPKLL